MGDRNRKALAGELGGLRQVGVDCVVGTWKGADVPNYFVWSPPKSG
jgi:hypothetical protein